MNFGNVQLTGMVLACVTGMILSLVFYVFDKLKLTTISKPKAVPADIEIPSGPGRLVRIQDFFLQYPKFHQFLGTGDFFAPGTQIFLF